VEGGVVLEAVDGIAFEAFLVEEHVDDFVWEVLVFLLPALSSSLRFSLQYEI
jgi:hypothetical protein